MFLVKALQSTVRSTLFVADGLANFTKAGYERNRFEPVEGSLKGRVAVVTGRLPLTKAPTADSDARLPRIWLCAEPM